jgi:transposase
MNATTYGLDVAKRVFQLYWVEAQTGEIVNRRFGRDELIRFLAQRPAGRGALEACGSGHWWARKIQALGHEVVLLHAKFIRPFAAGDAHGGDQDRRSAGDAGFTGCARCSSNCGPSR